MIEFEIPRVPASAGALIGDGSGRILVLKPTYKSGWTIPGGQMEAEGESPWEACRREVLEETGLTVTSGRLVCVDFLRPRSRRPGGLRFLFDCGSVGPEDAVRLLSGPVGRRVGRALASTGPLYLEEGVPVAGVG